MTQDVYFTEDLRWPSRSQRFGWLMTPAVVIFILFQLNVHLFQPVVAGAVLLLLVSVMLIVLTVQQRLTVRIGIERDTNPLAPVVGRILRRAGADEGPDPRTDTAPALLLTIVYTSRNPISALSPGRRGSRLGRREIQILFEEIENWSTARLPHLATLRGGPTTFPVGMHRDGIAIRLTSGERLLLPTQAPIAFLEALSLAKVDSIKQGRPGAVMREEL